MTVNRTGLYLPGISGSYVSTPNAASLNIPGDLGFVAHASPADWDSTTFIAKYDSGGDRQYFFSATSDALKVGVDIGSGASLEIIASTDTVSAADGQPLWVAATVDVDNGVSGWDVKFWTSDDGINWTQLGDTVTTATPITINTTTVALDLGVNNRTGSSPSYSETTLYYAAVFDGIGDNSEPGLGTLVAEFNASAPVEPRYRDSTGKIWTINGSDHAWEVRD